MALKKITYNGSSKVIINLCKMVNQLIDGAGSPSASDVSYDNTGSGLSAENVQDAIDEVYGDIPTKTSDLTNDSGFITNAVNNLVNYYLKSETYTQAEVDALISAIATVHFEVVQTLPVSDIQTNVIYLVPSSDPGTQNIYDEYINTTGTSAGWELIGSTQVDLSDYVTTQDLNTALANYVTSADLTTILADYVESEDLATVATTGDYNDLSNKPTIPAAQVQSDWNQSDSTAVDYIKNKPSIPSGGVTDVEVNGSSVVSGGVASVTVPTKVSDLNNDSGFITDNPTFTEASTRANIASGESFATILGKIKKWFSDLTSMFVSKTGDTMTGILNVNAASDTPLRIKRTNTNGYVYLLFSNSDGNLGYYAVGTDKKPYFEPAGGSDVRIALLSDVPTNTQYVKTASTSSIGSVIVTHAEQSSGGRTQMFAYGNGNGNPYLIEIVIGQTYVSCVVLCGIASKVGVKYIDTTHFAITSGNWDVVNVCAAYSDFSVAIADANQGIASSTTYYPIAGSVKDYNNNIPTYFGYSTAEMAQSAVTYICAWDASVSGQYRVRAVKQADLRVAYATSAGDASKVGGYSVSTSATANTVALRQGNGYLYATYYNASNGEQNINSYSGALVMFKDTNGWQRCTSRLQFAKWLTNESLSTSAGYFVTLTNSWANFGYSSAADVKTVLGLKSAAYITAATGATASTVAQRDSSGHLTMSDCICNSVKVASSSEWLPLRGGGAVTVRNYANSAYVPALASAFTVSSSRRYKENIVDMTEEDAEDLLALRVVTFDYKEGIVDGNRTGQKGLISEEVEEIETFPVVYNQDGEVEGLDYSKFVPQLIKLCQMQQKQIDALIAGLEEVKRSIK